MEVERVRRAHLDAGEQDFFDAVHRDDVDAGGFTIGRCRRGVITRVPTEKQPVS